jgi:hypothetical protein
LNVFDIWHSTLSFTLLPRVLVLLSMLFTGHFLRVPMAKLTQAWDMLPQF